MIPYFFVLYDPPHLLQDKNNLKRSCFCANEERISWKYVEQFYNIDSSLPIRMAQKLTVKHVSLPPFDRVSVTEPTFTKPTVT